MHWAGLAGSSLAPPSFLPPPCPPAWLLAVASSTSRRPSLSSFVGVKVTGDMCPFPLACPSPPASYLIPSSQQPEGGVGSTQSGHSPCPAQGTSPWTDWAQRDSRPEARGPRLWTTTRLRPCELYLLPLHIPPVSSDPSARAGRGPGPAGPGDAAVSVTAVAAAAMYWPRHCARGHLPTTAL